MIGIGIMGYGTVGSGVAEVLQKNRESIAKKAGDELRVQRILDLRDFPGDPFEDKLTKDFQDILGDPDIRIVVETMGGLHPAYDFVKACLEAGKSVVTSNKELVAEKGDELLRLARDRNLNFLFEASVGGGIPILRPLNECLAGNEVYEIAGILNGTTNFMLTQMIEQHMTFDDALALAQRLGYAERDPSADVDGHDACRKICILASLAFGIHVFPKDVYTEGVRDITLDDVATAAAMDGVIKLIGRVKRTEDGHITISVAPTVLPKTNLLSDVNDVFNGILVRGDAIGDVVFYGRGAGKLPTASAVVGDVIDEAKHLETRKSLFWEPAKDGYVRPHGQAECAFLVRLSCENRQTALAAVTAAFGTVHPIDRKDAPDDELAFVTPVAPEDDTLSKLSALRGVRLLSRIRVAE
ncbi:MAG: homoserine dehydrogenase [Clostridia bacterium]|nr:homoserine dehydrogenase [Clostridia bacterium]